jgi:hypothetical protein
MAAWTSRVSTPDTGNTPNTSGAFTPIEGDLLVVAVATSGSLTATEVPTASANGITFAAVPAHAIYRTSADSLDVFVAEQLVGAGPVSMTVSWSPTDTGTGTVIWVGSLSAMQRVSFNAVRQVAFANNGAASTTPAGTFSGACLTENPTLAFVANATNPATMTPPTTWTERTDTGYATPTSGVEIATRDSGFTGTTITWGGTSSTVWGAVVMEFDSSAPPAGNNFTETPTDTLGLTDSALVEKAAVLSPADTEGLTDAVTLDRDEAYADNLGLTDSVSVVGPVRYVTDVSANGRYFLDQDGNPILIRGESPWAMFTDLSSSEMDTYLQNRAGYGCNLALVSMIGSVANGGPADTGATYDGVLPFTGGNPTVFNETYWSRMDSYIAKARDLGITLMIYPMDGWNTAFASVVFNPGSISNTQCQTYGQTLATRYLSYPNIVWAFGGDYNEDATINDRFNACLTGIRAAGDTRPASIQLLYETSESHNSSFWETKVDWNWVYTYYVTYKGTSDAYNYTWSQAPTVRPALFSEGAYENSGSPHFGTDEALRRQACWALTSGSPGELTGQEDVWDFQSGWASLLDTTAADQIKAIRDTFEALDWWTLIPDDANQLVTAGRGIRITTDSATFPVSNNYVTAARATDGSLAVIYLPNAASAITVDMGEIGANPTATWVDPTTGGTFSETPDGSYSRGNNAAADSDWLLILTGDAAAGTNFTQTPSDALGVTDTATPVLTPPTPEVVFSVAIQIG